MMRQLEEALRLIRLVQQNEQETALRANRRHHVRVEVGTPLEYRLRRWQHRDLSRVQGLARGVTLDVSLGGLSFMSDLELPVGLVVEIRFLKEPWSFVSPLEAEVVRSQKQRDQCLVGGQFLPQPHNREERLHAVLLNELRSRSIVEQRPRNQDSPGL